MGWRLEGEIGGFGGWMFGWVDWSASLDLDTQKVRVLGEHHFSEEQDSFGFN